MSPNKTYSKDDFIRIKSKYKLAEFLNYQLKFLSYYAFKAKPEEKYITYNIVKRCGDLRRIDRPIKQILDIQNIIASILTEIYKPKACVHGFVKNRSIISNAKKHTNKRYLFNIDLENFFPTINYFRVNRLFQSIPFNFNEQVAGYLANICCFNNQLPQGAPTSPIISNFICYKMDKDIIKLAEKQQITYTRYADDITFSSDSQFSTRIIDYNENGKVCLGGELKSIIEDNGFVVKKRKIYLKTSAQRQVVTGLLVNKKVNVHRKYIRQLRAIFNAWNIYGLDKTAKEYFTKYDIKNRVNGSVEKFIEIIRGKINFIGNVKGYNDKVYIGICKKAESLHYRYKFKYGVTNIPIIYTEGESDWKHLIAAYHELKEKRKINGIEIEFCKYLNQMGNNRLMKICQEKRMSLQDRKCIYILDNDTKSINNDHYGKQFVDWGNNVFSFILPIPEYRHKECSIELYYKDEDIKTKDIDERRLYLSNEFVVENGKHKTENCDYNNCDKLKKPYVYIIDAGVYSENNKSMALSKARFAENIYEKKKGYENVDFSEFINIFKIIDKIIKY